MVRDNQQIDSSKSSYVKRKEMEQINLNADNDDDGARVVIKQCGGAEFDKLVASCKANEKSALNNKLTQLNPNPKPTLNGHIHNNKSFGGGGENNIVPTSKHNAKSGYVRHMVAVLALSSIVMANMNRQAYNQALVRMIRPSVQKSETSNIIDQPTTIASNEKQQTTSVLPLDDYSSEQQQITSTPWPLSSVELSTVDSNHQNDDDDDNNKLNRLDESEIDTFDWSGQQISMLQSGFSYGYTLFMIPGGRLSEVYGAKWIIFISGLGSALCSLATPYLAGSSFALLVASRVIMGLCQTGVSPALYALCTRWLAPDESSVYLPMIRVGVMLGFMSGSLVNGFMPWRSVFYVLGVLGCLWSALWAVCVTSDPADHKFINSHELEYIRANTFSRRTLDKKANNGEKEREKQVSAPWWGIITNPVVLAFTFTKFTVKLSTDMQSMQIPMYLRRVHQISDQLNGILNGANFAIQAIFTGFIAFTAKEMVVRRTFGLGKTGVRRLFQGTNNLGMALAYMLISFSDGSLTMVSVAVIMLSILAMFGAGGESVVPIDLTPEYSASIMAIANCVANLSGVVLPPVVSFLLANHLSNPDNWRLVFWFVSSVMILGGLIFSCLVKAKYQDFSRDGASDDKPIGSNGTSSNVIATSASVKIELKQYSSSKL